MHITRALLLCILYFACVYSQCPWADANLKKWSVAASWPSGVVPAANSDVLIPAGSNILLDVSPPALKSIIVDGGSLVWGNQDSEVITGALIAKNKGAIIIGSESCLFTKKAIITLTGAPTSTNYTGFGNKVLGVGANGTLELHGAAFTPTWTRLTQTHRPVSWSITALGRGMNVAILNADGTLKSWKSFDTYLFTNNSEAMATYINSQAAGTVIAVVAADEASRSLTPNGTAALRSIGSWAITQLKYRSGWACVGVKGAANGTAVEDLKNETMRPTVVVSRTFSGFTIQAQAFSPYGGFIKAVPGGNPILTLANNVNWQVGQQIVLASSDNDYKHAEQNEIVQIVSGNQIKLKYPFNFTHWGNIENGVDERAEVGLLSRSIVVRGKQANDNDTYGGHTRFLVNFTNVHIENAEFYQMGQDGVIGAYPIHFHMAFDVDGVGKYTKPAYVKNNSIHKSFNRCVTIHGTSGLLVQGNVAYNHKGHCYFLEDGSEMRNVIDNNLGLSTHYGNSILSDFDPARCTGVLAGFCKGPATFWLTNPNNTLTNNVAAGSISFGIWYIFPASPTGLSSPYYPNLKIQFIPLGKFKNNVAHSAPRGLMVDDGIVSTPGPTYLGIAGARYRPHETSSMSSPRVPANWDDLTVHHTTAQGAWLRGGDHRVNRGKFADNVLSITLASEGTMPNDPGSSQTITDSIFIGISNNNQSFLLSNRVRGFDQYDGPVRVLNCTFINFPDTNRNSSAITGHANNYWQSGITNEVVGAKFTNVFKRIWLQNPIYDGDRNFISKDTDGLVLGRAGWNMVSRERIHQTKRCVDLPESQAYSCPDKFGQLYIYNRNTAGTNYTGGSNWILYRDEKSTFPMPMIGINTSPPSSYQPLVVLGKSYTLHFSHPSPPKIGLQMTNWDQRDSLRVGVCYPPNTNFSVSYKKGYAAAVPLVAAANLAAVDASTNSTNYFWDNARGLLFVKLVAQNNRNGLEYCGNGGCESIEITATGPNVGKAGGVCASAYPFYAKTEA